MSCSKRLTPQGAGLYNRGGYWERNADGEYTRRVDQSDEEYPSRNDESWESGGIVLF
jgi:hypothetical protein